LLLGLRLKRNTLLSLMACLLWSSPISRINFVAIQEPITIKSQKNSPPHVAFDEIWISEQENLSDWLQAQGRAPLVLQAGKTTNQTLTAKKLELAEMVIRKTAEPVYISTKKYSGQNSHDDLSPSESWIEELPRLQAMRLKEAQRRSDILGVKGLEPDQTIAKEEIIAEPKVAEGGLEKGEAQGTHKSIFGPIEITGGLAVTNEHHIEVRRRVEGVVKELGRVDLRQGTYNIQVEEPRGSIVAQLVDKSGQVIGEGSFRLSQFVSTTLKEKQQGPKLKIQPQPSYSGIVVSAYNARPTDSAPPQAKASFLKGAADIVAKSDGTIAMENVKKGSSTVMRAMAQNHLLTNSIVIAGEPFRAQLFPSSMISALREVVSQQRGVEVNPELGIIWGRVALDGKSMAGAEVFLESQPELDPVYFNELMLPDQSLTTSSSNGLFAFLDVKAGYHSLLATRERAILGYQNTIAENDAISEVEIGGTIKSQPVTLRVFDAFSGDEKAATLAIQSLENEIQLKNGPATIDLPRVNRVGIIRLQPESTEYLSARYFYNDQDEFIHLPLVSWLWVSNIKSYLRLEDKPNSGVVIGFVPDEDFEVYLAGNDAIESKQIVYFDMQGRILQNSKGVAGGGFILYNIPTDSHEVVVLGSRTQKIYSRLLPVDPGSLSVLTFQ